MTVSVDFYLGIWVEEKGQKYLTWIKDIDPEDEPWATINVANYSARKILATIGVFPPDDDLCGQLSIFQVRQLAETLDNPALQEPGYVDQGPGRATIISMGYDIDRMRGYAMAFEKLADLAEKYEADLIYFV
jgi:hypothetical protein